MTAENDDMWCGICKRTSTNSLDHDAEAHAAWAAQPQTEKAQPQWDDDPNHPEGVDCDGYPLSSGERCGKREHRRYVYSPGITDTTEEAR